jgi:hypothetical protein
MKRIVELLHMHRPHWQPNVEMRREAEKREEFSEETSEESGDSISQKWTESQ